MTSGVPVSLDHGKVVAKFNSGLTLTEIARQEGCHRSCVSKLLKRLGFKIIPSRATGPSKFYNKDHRIMRARKMIARGRAVLSSYNLEE